MEKRWFIKYIGNHWVGCSHTTPYKSILKLVQSDLTGSVPGSVLNFSTEPVRSEVFSSLRK